MKNMEKILKQLSLVLVLAYFQLKTGHSELIVFPHDTEVLVNHSTYLNCSTSVLSEQIHWYHYRVGENRTNYVYYKGQFNKDYADRYSIEIDTVRGEYNLIIRSIQPGDGGRYACQDDGGLGSLSSAELIVLDSTPICQSSMKPDGLVGINSCGLPIDELQLSCSVSYSGNIPPALQWKMEGDDTPILKGITIDYSGKHMMMNLTMSSELEMDGALFACSNTRPHYKQHNCTTGPVKIDYAVHQPTILNITIGETVTCSANASVPCTYRWFYGNDSLCPASCNQVLTTSRLGNYSCEASCPMNGLSCSFVAIRIFVFENETSNLQWSNVKTVIIAVLVPTFTILLILLITLAMRYSKMRQDKAKSDKLCEVFRKTMRMQEGRQCTIIENTNIKITHMNAVKTLEAQTSAEAQPLLPYESIIADNDDEEKRNTRTNVAEETRGKPIAGIAILDNLLYVVFGKVSAVETYDVETLCCKNYFKLKKLSNPWDLASCKKNKCLYIMDLKIKEKVAKTIFRVDVGVKSISKWSTNDDFGTLSVTPDGNVILTVREKNRLNIYKPGGKRVRVVKLNEDLVHPLHTIQLSNGHFMITHGFGDDALHRICIIDVNGEFVQNSFVLMETPTFMVASEKGSVFVADSDNGDVFTLNSSDLDLERTIVTRSHGLRCPQRICLDEGKGRLFVADNEFGEFNRRNGRLLAVDLTDLAT